LSRILLIGATGFIGPHLVRELAQLERAHPPDLPGSAFDYRSEDQAIEAMGIKADNLNRRQ